MVNMIETLVYAGRIKDNSILLNSSSGGAFTALSDYFLKNGNAVVSTIYNYKNHTAEYKMILNQQQRDSARGSKYMQSKPGDIYKKAYSWLINNPNKKLLFVGMGCQADGFRKYCEIKGVREQVYVVDIICHGSSSPKIWREYAESIQEKKGKITYLTFKDKRNGWKFPTAYVVVNGKEKFIDESSYPVLACDFINQNIDIKNSRFYNEYNYGSYMIFRNIPVFIDSRADLYDPKFSHKENDIFMDYINTDNLNTFCEETFEKYQITHIITQNGSSLNK